MINIFLHPTGMQFLMQKYVKIGDFYIGRIKKAL